MPRGGTAEVGGDFSNCSSSWGDFQRRSAHAAERMHYPIAKFFQLTFAPRWHATLPTTHFKYC